MNKQTKPFSVLCVDDEDDFLLLLEESILEIGHGVLKASTGVEGLKILSEKQNEIILIISDIQMPEMNGYEFRQKCLEHFGDIPFVFLSGYISREEALKAVELKVSRFIDKPVDFATIEKILKDVTGDRISALKEDRELLEGFVADAEALLEEMESILLSMDGGGSDVESINRIFAIAHTIKGSSGFFKPDTVHRFTHKFEDFLSPFKKENRELNSVAVGVCLKSLDIIKQLLSSMLDGSVSSFALDDLLQLFEVNHAPSAESSGTVGSVTSGDTKGNAGAKAAEAKVKEEVRVGIDVLDQFMELSGEITVIRNVINKQVRKIEKQFSGNRDVALLATMIDEMLKINGSLQDKVVELRKVQLKNVVRPLHRTVRDLSDSLKKDIHLEITGESLKVDTSIAEVLGSSLIHMVRNSADHGIEMPSDREAAGKSKTGTIHIKARQISDSIHVELIDDGKGLNRELIRKKIVEKNLRKDDEAKKMTDSELYSMIFESGFSTAAKVTDVSGRGVGMDMVKKSIMKIGGKIDIQSKEGKGTIFKFILPVPKSVTIVASLLVRADDSIYSLPQEAIVKVMSLNRVENSEDLWSVRSLAGADVLEINDHILPLVDLGRAFHVDDSLRSKSKTLSTNDGYLVVLNSNGFEFGIRVDEVLDLEDSVVKKLGKHMKELSHFAGATFLGENQVGLILDIAGLAGMQGIRADEMKSVRNELRDDSSGTKLNVRDVLLLDIGVPGVWGVELSQVNRLEKVFKKDIQFSGQQPILIYRNETMPLYCLGNMLNFNSQSCHSAIDRDEFNVLVMEQNGKMIGFMVREIIDMVQAVGDASPLMESRKGVLGGLIINDQTVTMLSLKEAFESRNENQSEQSTSSQVNAA
jgi:two-component system chemotaxis sensor kinase CheA